MIKLILMVGTGSFAGGVARFLLSRFVQTQSASSFPYGTLSVNLIGCLLIGIFFGLSERWPWMNSEWRIFLTVGLCGGFTTFSAFAHENLILLKDGNYLFFLLYTGLSIAAGLAAVVLGNIITKIF
jgi:fluoride exporter